MCFWIGLEKIWPFKIFLIYSSGSQLVCRSKIIQAILLEGIMGKISAIFFALVPVLFDITFVSHFISIGRNTHPTSLFSWNLLIYHDFKLKYDILDTYTRIS